MNENDFDSAAVEYVTEPAVDALAQAEKLAADERYSEAHKQTEIARLFDVARSETESRYTEELARLDEGQPTLEAQSRARFAPAKDDAALLLYVRDALKERVRAMRPAEIKQLWEHAIADGDTITARVFADFGRTLTFHDDQQRRPVRAFTDNDYRELTERTEAMTLTAEQRRARAALQRAAATRTELARAKAKALARTSGQFVLQNGQLVDASRAAMQTMIRNNF